MDPTHDTSPDESALPDVSSQPPAAGSSFGAPLAEPSSLEGQPAVPETAPPIATAPPSGGGAASSWLPPTVPVQAAGTGSNDDQPQSPAGTVPAPATADDGDVIEKEWVEKAKQIVARTRQDPYNQTKELHKFKAEYMQKRYNKTIEAVEE